MNISPLLRIAGVLASALIIFCATGIVAILTYQWSFTDFMFGGYAGVVIPVLMCLCCAVAGFLGCFMLRAHEIGIAVSREDLELLAEAYAYSQFYGLNLARPIDEALHRVLDELVKHADFNPTKWDEAAWDKEFDRGMNRA